jgi:hypothetical protein
MRRFPVHRAATSLGVALALCVTLSSVPARAWTGFKAGD